MTDFGVTPTGFVIKTQADIVTSLREGVHAQPDIGPNQDVSEFSALGQLIGVFAGALAEVWELAEESFAGLDPNAAEDYALTVLASITGTDRRAAAPSTVAATLNLDAGTTVPGRDGGSPGTGSLVAVSGRPDVVFELLTSVTNSSGVTANFSGDFECTTTGPNAAPAGSLTDILTPVVGWNSVTNALDAAFGRDVDNDTLLRQRRQTELTLRGGSTIAAIAADLLAASDDIDAALVIENTTNAVDTNGLPPHSFEALIDDGDTPSVDDDLVAQTIWDSKPAGIATSGSASGTATDEASATHAVAFSRVTLKPVYIALTLTRGSLFPTDGDAQVKEAIVDVGREAYGIGDDVIRERLRAACFSVAGVEDVPAFALDYTASPTATSNLTVGVRERATFDTSRITVA